RRFIPGLFCCLTALPLAAQELIQARIGDELFRLELAADPDSRRQGLMEREALPAGSGMLFDFPSGATPAIWMRNMRISLDLLFVDGQARIRQMFHSVPPCEDLPCEIYQEQHPLRFVIELPAGTADRLGPQGGDALDPGGRARTPAPSLCIGRARVSVIELLAPGMRQRQVDRMAVVVDQMPGGPALAADTVANTVGSLEAEIAETYIEAAVRRV